VTLHLSTLSFTSVATTDAAHLVEIRGEYQTALVSMSHEEWRVLCEAVKAREELDSLKSDHQRLVMHGPWWMQYGLAKMHAEVDQTDPNCPIGSALTRAGFERRPLITETGEADAIEHEIVRLRRETAALKAKESGK
jgi:hypothetical protein